MNYNISHLPLETQFSAKIMLDELEEANEEDLRKLSSELLISYLSMQTSFKELLKQQILQDMQNNVSFIIL